MEQHNQSTGWKITTIYASADGESHFGEKSIVRPCPSRHNMIGSFSSNVY
jgi:hypothetical protein